MLVIALLVLNAVARLCALSARCDARLAQSQHFSGAAVLVQGKAGALALF